MADWSCVHRVVLPSLAHAPLFNTYEYKIVYKFVQVNRIRKVEKYSTSTTYLSAILLSTSSGRMPRAFPFSFLSDQTRVASPRLQGKRCWRDPRQHLFP